MIDDRERAETATYAAVAETIRSRRTNMAVDRDRQVPHDLVRELCDLAQWAPNHKRTWPWRFALVEGDARGPFGEAIADSMRTRGDPEAKVNKTRGKYLRTPATLVIGSVPGDSPLRTLENRDAVAAGVQNVLLAGTATGIATFWSSCPKGADEVVAAFCGFDAETAIVALIYLGWPIGGAEVPARPPVDLRIIG